MGGQQVAVPAIQIGKGVVAIKCGNNGLYINNDSNDVIVDSSASLVGSGSNNVNDSNKQAVYTETRAESKMSTSKPTISSSKPK